MKSFMIGFAMLLSVSCLSQNIKVTPTAITINAKTFSTIDNVESLLGKAEERDVREHTTMLLYRSKSVKLGFSNAGKKFISMTIDFAVTGAFAGNVNIGGTVIDKNTTFEDLKKNKDIKITLEGSYIDAEIGNFSLTFYKLRTSKTIVSVAITSK